MATRSQLKHAIRASCAIIEQPGVIVIGSQSILATWPDADLPEAATRSMELDICPLNDDAAESLATVLEGAIGELSPFHNTFGFYIDGVGRNTATLPKRFAERLLAVVDDQTNGYVGYCLDPHDLCIAKLVANRYKDNIFVDELINYRIVDPRILEERLSETRLSTEIATRIKNFLTPHSQFWDKFDVKVERPKDSLAQQRNLVSLARAESALEAFVNRLNTK